MGEELPFNFISICFEWMNELGSPTMNKMTERRGNRWNTSRCCPLFPWKTGIEKWGGKKWEDLRYTFDVMGIEIENRKTQLKFSRRLASTLELTSNLLLQYEQSFLGWLTERKNILGFSFQVEELQLLKMNE